MLCAEQVQLAVRQLSNMDNASAILKACEEIDRLESEADHIMRAAMAPGVRPMAKSTVNISGGNWKAS